MNTTHKKVKEISKEFDNFCMQQHCQACFDISNDIIPQLTIHPRSCSHSDSFTFHITYTSVKFSTMYNTVTQSFFLGTTSHDSAAT
jgi:hypothetical protein